MRLDWGGWVFYYFLYLESFFRFVCCSRTYFWHMFFLSICSNNQPLHIREAQAITCNLPVQPQACGLRGAVSGLRHGLGRRSGCTTKKSSTVTEPSQLVSSGGDGEYADNHVTMYCDVQPTPVAETGSSHNPTEGATSRPSRDRSPLKGPPVVVRLTT